jgi:hypothetical protein
MNKYQVSIKFYADEDFMSYVPAHRSYISKLINNGTIDQYSVALESGKAWITINAETLEEVEEILQKSPLHHYWDYEIDVIYIYDSQLYRFPKLVMN